MSPTLLKIYSFFIVVTLLFSSILISKKNSLNKEKTKQPFIVTQKDTKNDPSIVPPLEVLVPVSTTTIKEITQPEKINNTSTTNNSPFVTATKIIQSPTINQGTSEISPGDTDNQTTTARPNPCITPITYTLGSFDSRFTISKSYFLQIVAEDALMWDEAIGKKIFIYDTRGNPNDLTINLIYDYRQQRTDDNKLLNVEIDNTKDAALLLQKEYEEMKVIFSNLKDTYMQSVESFNARQKTYNDTVISWNEKGGAPRVEYDALALEKEALIKETQKLTNDKLTLDTLLTSINAKITKYNELVLFANNNVDINNSTANKKFTEGNYNSGTNKINIYQFTNDISLRRVIAHELGHALGIDHTKNKQSIMYAMNTATTTTLTQEDIQSLQDICSK